MNKHPTEDIKEIYLPVLLNTNIDLKKGIVFQKALIEAYDLAIKHSIKKVKCFWSDNPHKDNIIKALKELLETPQSSNHNYDSVNRTNVTGQTVKGANHTSPPISKEQGEGNLCNELTICHNCQGVLFKFHMGLKCPYCKEWLYNHLSNAEIQKFQQVVKNGS